MSTEKHAAEKRLKPHTVRVVRPPDPSLGGIKVEESMVPYWEAVAAVAEALRQSAEHDREVEDAQRERDAQIAGVRFKSPFGLAVAAAIRASAGVDPSRAQDQVLRDSRSQFIADSSAEYDGANADEIAKLLREARKQ